MLSYAAMTGSIQVAYRDHDRTPLLYVLREMAERHEDLEVRVEQVGGPRNYDQEFLSGKLDLVCESFRFLFPARRDGYPVRVLAATHNFAVERLLVRPGIHSLLDLEGKRVVIRATESSRITSLNWLRHLGLEDRVKALVVDDREVGRWQQWRKVAAGEAEAVICSPLYLQPPLDAGLQVLSAPPLPQLGPLYFAALAPFIAQHDDELRRFIRALYRALHAFHHDPDLTLSIISGEPARLMGLEGEATIRRAYEALRGAMATRPIPRLDSLIGTYEMLSEEMGGLELMNPLTLWDLRYVLELEDARFMESLAA